MNLGALCHGAFELKHHVFKSVCRRTAEPLISYAHSAGKTDLAVYDHRANMIAAVVLQWIQNVKGVIFCNHSSGGLQFFYIVFERL